VVALKSKRSQSRCLKADEPRRKGEIMALHKHSSSHHMSKAKKMTKAEQKKEKEQKTKRKTKK